MFKIAIAASVDSSLRSTI